MSPAGVTPPFLPNRRLAPDGAGLFSCRGEKLETCLSRSVPLAVLQEPGAHATALPSSTLLRPFRCMGAPSAPDFGPR